MAPSPFRLPICRAHSVNEDKRMRQIMNACTRCTSIFGHKLEKNDTSVKEYYTRNLIKRKKIRCSQRDCKRHGTYTLSQREWESRTDAAAWKILNLLNAHGNDRNPWYCFGDARSPAIGSRVWAIWVHATLPYISLSSVKTPILTHRHQN